LVGKAETEIDRKYVFSSIFPIFPKVSCLTCSGSFLDGWHMLEQQIAFNSALIQAKFPFNPKFF
jgi:hypothetical protein